MFNKISKSLKESRYLIDIIKKNNIDFFYKSPENLVVIKVQLSETLPEIANDRQSWRLVEGLCSIDDTRHKPYSYVLTFATPKGRLQQSGSKVKC